MSDFRFEPVTRMEVAELITAPYEQRKTVPHEAYDTHVNSLTLGGVEIAKLDLRPPGVESICDFCSEPTTLGKGGELLEVPPFELHFADINMTHTYGGPGWLACPTCAALVHAGEEGKLLGRSVDHQQLHNREGRSRGYVVRNYTRIQQEFWKRWRWIQGPVQVQVTPELALKQAMALMKSLEDTRWPEHRNLSGLGHARVVIWRKDLWRAAQRGAHEAFVGQMHPYQVLNAEPQFWFFDPRNDTLDHPPLLAKAGMSPYCRYLCMFVCRIESDHGPSIEHGIFYVDPGENFEEHTIRIVAPEPQLLALPCEDSFVLIAAALTFMGQAFCVMKSHPHPHHLARKAAKKHRHLPEVQVIQLRRNMEPFGEPRFKNGAEASDPKEWSCCWINAAHWKMQPHGPRNSLRKQIYVVPKAVRGDLSKPLREPKGTVYLVSR